MRKSIDKIEFKPVTTAMCFSLFNDMYDIDFMFSL